MGLDLYVWICWFGISVRSFALLTYLRNLTQETRGIKKVVFQKRYDMELFIILK